MEKTYQCELEKAARKLDKALNAITEARTMTEPGTADNYRLTAALYLLRLTGDQVEAAAGGPTVRICGERERAEWKQSEFRQGFDAAMDVFGAFLRSLELAEDDGEREAAVDKIFTERDRLTSERSRCKMGASE